MSSNPKAFAERVLAAFESAGHVTDEDVVAAGGPSTTTLTKYRKVAAGEMTMKEPRGDVLRRIDLAADWRVGSARALWRTQELPDSPRPTGIDLLDNPRPGRKVRVDGPDGYVNYLAERLSEVEERLDLLTALIEGLGKPRLVAADDTPGIDDEAEADDTP